MYLHGLQRWRPLNSGRGLCADIWLRSKLHDHGLGLWPTLFSGPVCDESVIEAVHLAIVALDACTLPFFELVATLLYVDKAGETL